MKSILVTFVSMTVVTVFMAEAIPHHHNEETHPKISNGDENTDEYNQGDSYTSESESQLRDNDESIYGIDTVFPGSLNIHESDQDFDQDANIDHPSIIDEDQLVRGLIPEFPDGGYQDGDSPMEDVKSGYHSTDDIYGDEHSHLDNPEEAYEGEDIYADEHSHLNDN